MSLQALNKPLLVASGGLAVLAGTPWATALLGSASLGLVKALNLTAFLINAGSVSMPGRIDEQQDTAMRGGQSNPSKPEATLQNENSPLAAATTEYTELYSPNRGRTLVSPSGWAFAIWGPIYVGELIFVAAPWMTSSLDAILPVVTAPFIAANLLQSLWCASFRPSYTNWASYVSCGMLAGTAFSLSQVQTAVSASTTLGSAQWFFVPLIMHFGWTTAATLVNINGSVAMNDSSDRLVTAVGHGSALVATLLGMAGTIAYSSPLYGLTISWALAACGDGMKKRLANASNAELNVTQTTSTNVQKNLCFGGAVLTALSSAYVVLA